MREASRIIFAVFLLPIITVAAEISETNEVLRGEISFYTQSSAGVLSTCGIEFNGIDKDLNYFSGSYGFLYFEEQGPVPIFKIKSSKISLDGSKQRYSISSAWIQSDAETAIGENWVGNTDGDTFLLVGKDVEKGASIYTDLISGKVIKVGFLHKGDSIDKVYRLRGFQKNQEQEAASCLVEMINQFVNK